MDDLLCFMFMSKNLHQSIATYRANMRAEVESVLRINCHDDWTGATECIYTSAESTLTIAYLCNDVVICNMYGHRLCAKRRPISSQSYTEINFYSAVGGTLIILGILMLAEQRTPFGQTGSEAWVRCHWNGPFILLK